MELAPSQPATPHVELVGVSKHFGGVQALRGVDLTVEQGEVHALVGENGAGKSTAARIVAGLLTADGGALHVGGEEVAFRSPREALGHGIATIAQELALVPSLTVAENVYLGSEPRRAGFIRRRALRARFAALSEEAGFDLRPDALVGGLRTADQQKVEILRALSRGASFIIMDEPTAALSRPDAERLHNVVRSLARSGRTVLLVSHFLSEVLELADTVTVLRDGRLVRTSRADQETESSLVEAMLGHTMDSVFPDKPEVAPDARAVLEVRGLHAAGVNGVSFEVRAGEIVGLAGLVGAGRSEIAHAVMGAVRKTGGAVDLTGSPLRARTPTAALRRGVVLIPEDRKEQGLLLQRSIKENATIASLRDYSVAGWVGRRREQAAASRKLTEVRVQTPSVQLPVSSLSGGNQQKVMFARAMLCGPRVLIADEPTRGVDIGARRAIYDLLVEQAEAGVAVLVISSDLEEVLGLAHRILVVRAGRIAAELEGEEMTEANVLRAAFSEQGRTENDEQQEATTR